MLASKQLGVRGLHLKTVSLEASYGPRESLPQTMRLSRLLSPHAQTGCWRAGHAVPEGQPS